MRCDRAVTLLATGGVLGHWLARRHADRCPGCAAEAARLRRIAVELAATEPLSAAQRALWASASAEPRPSRARTVRSRPPLLAGSAAAAVVLVSVIAAVIVARRPSPAPGPSIDAPGVPVIARPDVRPKVSPSTIRELDDLKANLQALSQDLGRLRRRAELLDERRDAEAISRRFDRPVASRNPPGTPLALTWDASPSTMGPGDPGVATAPPRPQVDSHPAARPPS